jgi:hypothetical protein
MTAEKRKHMSIKNIMANTMRFVLIAAALSGSAIIGLAQAENVKNPELAGFIDSLAVEDQKPYQRVQKGEITAAQAERDFQAATRRNYAHLKKIVKKYGFPSFDLVGKTSSHNFWMMVQHSDFDVKFQKKVLKKMRQAVKKQDASAQDYAFLVDRVKINTNEPQLYGTQITVTDVNKGYELKPVYKPEELNRRRKEIGLPPVEEYLEKANKLFFELNKDKLNKQ